MFLLIFLLGFSLLALISKDFKLTEKLALAMPIGLGLTSFIMFFLDRIIHSITANGVMLSVGILMVAFSSARLYIDSKANDLPWKRERKKMDLSWLTLVWVVFAAAIAYLAYGITEKCLYWPAAEFDTILGYDLLSKAIAHEHTIFNSILTNKDIVNDCGPRLLYPPLLALCNSICYLTGMETSKWINAFFFISWVFIAYLLLRRFISASGAIFFTFLIIITPEMFAHASFSLTNLPCAIYTTIAVISFIIWYEKKKEGFFYLSFISIIFGLWTRSEAVLFVGGIMLVLMYVAIREKRYKYLLIYATSVIPFLTWNMLLKAYVPRAQTGFFITKFFYDPSKMKQVLNTAWEIMGSSNIYGLTFYFSIIGLFLILISNISLHFNNKKNKYVLGGFVLWLLIYFAVGANLLSLVLFAALMLTVSYINHEKWELMLIFFLGLGAYTLMFYQIKPDDGTLFSPGGWMQSGYKRGLFCYAPLGLFIVATSNWAAWTFGKLDEQLRLFKKPE
jgi:ABC-type multidrug transport system fused ATPase/permease subunit